MKDCMAQSGAVPEALVGELQDSSALLEDAPKLRQVLEFNGYLYLRGAVDRDEVLAARNEVFNRLAEAIEGIATGRSRRAEIVGDLGAFWTSVSNGPALRRVTHGLRLRELMGMLYGEPARPHDYLFLRPAPVGRATNLHYDFPFFAGGSERIVTCWVPLGEIPVTDGPLALVEGSNQFSDLLGPIRGAAIDAGTAFSAVQSAAYQEQTRDTLGFIRSRNTRLLTADFQAGDVVVFGMFTMHGSLDNHSVVGRVRLSVDVRYQPAADPAEDPRYFGPHPGGAKGNSYGEQKAAQPLTKPWVSRQ
jgi:hypothetical protein